jgi:hypothetical protein
LFRRPFNDWPKRDSKSKESHEERRRAKAEKLRSQRKVGMQMSISQKVNVMRKTQATTSQKEVGKKKRAIHNPGRKHN